MMNKNSTDVTVDTSRFTEILKGKTKVAGIIN